MAESHSKPHHLNYCRQLLRQAEAASKSHLASEQERVKAKDAIALCAVAKKFLLPPGGALIDDPQLRGIDESQELRLPFPCIALEYETPDAESHGRKILFAWEADGRLCIQLAFCSRADGFWYLPAVFGIPCRDYLQRTAKGVQYMVDFQGEFMVDHEGGGASVLLGFLNAISCSNVEILRSDPPKIKAKLRKALPFDSYHLLTIDVRSQAGGEASIGGSHRSPREHLRRGHIRRYESGLRVWVNATVVNPGVGGKVHKDYRVTA